MLVKVHLHGYLKDFHDGPVEVFARTIYDAVAYVTRSLEGFKPNAVHGRHRVRAAGCDTIDDLYRMVEEGQDIHLMPQFCGGKKGGFLQVIVGAALFAVGLVTGMPFLMKIGAMIFLGGLAAMLSPTPESEDDKVKSRYLGAPKNTVEIGTRIPILYGETQVYGHYLSFDIDATEVKN